MNNTNKRKIERHTSPVGTAVFPRLSEPDFKYKAEHGEYSVKLRLTEAEAKVIIAKAEAVAEESYQEQVAEHKGKKDKKGKDIVINKAEPSFTVELDDNQQPTGFYLIAFKMNGGYTDKKTKEKKSLKVPLFDAKGQPIKDKVEIWGGSKLKVAYQLVPYFAEADKKAGVSFRLDAVQVIELVSRGQGNASMFGFSAEEGYEHTEKAEEKPENPFEAKAEGATETGDAQSKARGQF